MAVHTSLPGLTIWQLLFGALTVVATSVPPPPDNSNGYVLNGGLDSMTEMKINDVTYLMQIVPSGFVPQNIQRQYKDRLSDMVKTGRNNDCYQQFINYLEKGKIMKGLIFNVYNKHMREAAIALYCLLDEVDYRYYREGIADWAHRNINDDLYRYATRLASLFLHKYDGVEKEPPFLDKPHYYINAETIVKALKIRSSTENYNREEARINQYYRTSVDQLGTIAINSNYSGWNSDLKGCNYLTNYFTEDISLNSYYYGIHIRHPFWMPNYKLNNFNPRQNEHYYFEHKQLLARYYLEKEHLKLREYLKLDCNKEYIPQLIYENGLPFPVRSNYKGVDNSGKEFIEKVIKSLKDSIAKGIVVDNGKTIKLTADNYIGLLAGMIRHTLDNSESAKVIRSIYGCGRNDYPNSKYDPQPSLLHHPETSLRDPVYWNMIENALNFINNYTTTLDPYNLSDYDSPDIQIMYSKFSRITTYFDYYQMNLNPALNSNRRYKMSPIVFTARLRRLKHYPFTLNFTVNSKTTTNATVRLFLGPHCYNNECFKLYTKFFQLDVFTRTILEGEQEISWSPETSDTFSFDDYYNMEYSRLGQKNRYNMFKFPNHLLIPRGTEGGSRFTLFIIITPSDPDPLRIQSLYNIFTNEEDRKPLGFPFHRPATIKKYSHVNYRFYNILIYHKTQFDRSGQFSSHLY